ncbi:dihydroanticapsin 7-dehydrogenase-like [Aplysia californica]|uniref:Dihydroanticapsin 7-dehydrogenase-like n=1 Tax=Aplysia californica TaxID=6500 RepID=A0ABM0JS50_APLCA|nr:dihydroanticapsin 7-dehydrogenase-like [Aplysia californica]
MTDYLEKGKTVTRDYYSGLLIKLPSELVNNAGIFAARFIKDLDENAVEENFNINFKVPVLLSKLALPHLLKTKEWGPAGIRVNSVSPGAIDTPIFSKILGGDKAKMDMVAQMQSKLHALQRNGEVTEVAETVAFLASDASSFVSGTVVFADGGRHSYPAGSGSFSGKSAF